MTCLQPRFEGRREEMCAGGNVCGGRPSTSEKTRADRSRLPAPAASVIASCSNTNFKSVYTHQHHTYTNTGARRQGALAPKLLRAIH